MPRVQITLKPGFDANLVRVDDHDITNIVSAIGFTRSADKPYAEVALHLRADQVEVDAELAEVVVVQAPALAQDPAQALDALLAGVDPGELEQAAFARMGGLDAGPTTVTEAFIATLRDWAKEG